MQDAVELPVSVIAPRHKVFKRAELVLMEQTEVLDVARYAFIGGELVLRMSEKLRLLEVWKLLYQWLVGFAGGLRSGDAATGAPEPDVRLMSWMIRDTEGRPGPGDSLLVAEVSGATLACALNVKARMNARAGIAEYWVVDLAGRRVIVHRRPEAGAYLDVAAYAEDEMVATLGAPEAAVRVGDLF